VVFDNYATTAGGLDNYSAGYGSAVGGGGYNLQLRHFRHHQRLAGQPRVRPRVHRSGGNHNNAHHSHSAVNGGRYNTAHDQDSTMGGYGEDGFGTIASDTVYGCAATIGVSIYTTDGQLVQTAPRSPAAAPTATGIPATLQSARTTPPLCTVRWRRYRGRGASSMVQ
jgi:hypothetical protein